MRRFAYIYIMLFYACGSLERVNLVGVLPGQVYIGSADMAEGGYLTVDRAEKIELLYYSGGTKVKYRVCRGRYLGVRDNARAEAVNKNGDGLVNANGVGYLDLTLVRKTCGDDVLRHVSCGVCRGAVNLCRILAGECAAAVA